MRVCMSLKNTMGMKTVNINDTNVVETIREAMYIASPNRKGLMPSSMYPLTNESGTEYSFDLNEIKRDARLIINQNTVNNPLPDKGWGCVLAITFNGVVIQLVFDYWAAASLYSRSHNNSRWSAWTKIK